jgi:hypothetical protein
MPNPPPPSVLSVDEQILTQLIQANGLLIQANGLLAQLVGLMTVLVNVSAPVQDQIK